MGIFWSSFATQPDLAIVMQRDRGSIRFPLGLTLVRGRPGNSRAKWTYRAFSQDAPSTACSTSVGVVG
jgi:hypothetical protein